VTVRPDVVMVASERGELGLPAGVEILAAGGSALDAVEAAVRLVESNPDDHFVGVGGIPNLLGVLELDASIMDGRTRAAGAVAAVRGFAHPISIARRLMERLPQHVMLVGEGAERFADDVGFQREETMTPEALRMWREEIRQSSWEGAGSEGERRYREAAVEMMRRMSPPKDGWGTVNVIARDQPVRRKLDDTIVLQGRRLDPRLGSRFPQIDGIGRGAEHLADGAQLVGSVG